MARTDDIETRAATLVARLAATGRTVATAESCTGGWIAKAITDVAGSSACFGYGFVTYSNEAKSALVGVSPATLARHGAVSEAVVREMARGALSASGADLAVAVSGIAGPDGGSDEKPVGTVCFAWAVRGADAIEVDAEQDRYRGDRATVRAASVLRALAGLESRIPTGER